MTDISHLAYVTIRRWSDVIVMVSHKNRIQSLKIFKTYSDFFDLHFVLHIIFDILIEAGLSTPWYLNNSE